MRNKVFKFRILLMIAYMIMPIIRIAAYAFSKETIAVYPVPFCIAGTLLFLAATIMTFTVPRDGEGSFTRTDSVLSGVLLFICIGFFLYYTENDAGLLFAAFAFAASFIMFWRTAKSIGGRVAVTVLAAVCVLGIVFLCTFIFDGHDGVIVNRKNSPDGSLDARVVDNFSRVSSFGDIEIYVYDGDSDIDLVLLRFIEIAEKNKLWHMDANELMDEEKTINYPAIEWRDNETLLINGEPYSINDHE